MSFKNLNNIGAWVVFFISLLTYTLTVEPTASFWDCGEFIACAFKLQVPHPAGAPFFLLIGRIASMFAGSDVTKVALMVNMVSVLASAFTILFMFWTISLIGRKIVGKDANEIGTSDTIKTRSLLVGAVVAGTGLLLVQHFGGYIMAHQLPKLTGTYGSFALALGMMFWIYLQAQIILYALEITAVRAQHDWPKKLF